MLMIHVNVPLQISKGTFVYGEIICAQFTKVTRR